MTTVQMEGCGILATFRLGLIGNDNACQVRSQQIFNPPEVSVLRTFDLETVSVDSAEMYVAGGCFYPHFKIRLGQAKNGHIPREMQLMASDSGAK